MSNSAAASIRQPNLKPMREAAQLDSLTGLRGVLAVAIIVFHYSYFWEIDVPTVEYGLIFPKMHVFVDMFFMMSGFIMGYVHWRDFATGIDWQGYKRYIALRIGRIYPVHFIVLAGFVVLELDNVMRGDFSQLEHPDRRPEAIITNLLLIHAWGTEPNLGWNYPSWSISAEWAAYLLFPVLVYIFLRPKTSIALVSFGTLIAAIFFLAGLPPEPHGAGGIDRTFELGAVRGIFSFSMGLGLFRLYHDLKLYRAMNSLASTLFSAGCIVALFVGFHFKINDGYLLLLVAAIVLSVTFDGNKVRWFFETSFIMFLGEISYSIYMVHALVQRVFMSLIGMGWVKFSGFWEAIIVSQLMLVVSVFAAYLLYILFEDPMRKLVRRWVKSIDAKAAAKAAAKASS